MLIGGYIILKDPKSGMLGIIGCGLCVLGLGFLQIAGPLSLKTWGKNLLTTLLVILPYLIVGWYIIVL